MPIEIRQTGEVEAAAAAGIAIGQAERAKEERARAEREAEQAAQARAQQVAREWDLQKMMLNSQQDFAHEQRLQQTRLDAEARSEEWQVEKMEMASRLDFEAEERERQREYGEFLNTDKYIRDKVTSGEWSEEKAEGPFFMNAYQHSKLDKPEIAERLGGSPEYVQKLQGGQPTTLTPEEQEKAARIKAGLAPRATAPKEEDLAKERRQLEAIVGELEMPSLLSLPELRQRAAEITGAGLVAPGGAPKQVAPLQDPLGIR
jgi:hypothetical protein